MEHTNPQTQKVFQGDFNLGQISDKAEIPAEPEQDEAVRDALLFTTALRGAHNAPDIRANKVEAIRAALAAGSYAIDAKRIAAALIRDDPELFRL